MTVKRDAQPLPRIDDTLDTLGTQLYFSILDLASGYWQVEVEPADQEKTAFARHCTWAVSVPCHAVWALQCPWNIPTTNGAHPVGVILDLYVDDIIILSQTILDHLNRSYMRSIDLTSESRP